jgi:hypothetical protein
MWLQSTVDLFIGSDQFETLREMEYYSPNTQEVVIKPVIPANENGILR